MENCNPVNTPIEVSSTLKKATNDEILCDQKLYQSIIGSLMWELQQLVPTSPMQHISLDNSPRNQQKHTYRQQNEYFDTKKEP